MPADRLLTCLGQTAQSNLGVRDHQLQHAMKLSVMEVHAGAPQMFIIGENPLYMGDALRMTLNMHRIRTKIDAHVEAVFHKPQIFIAGPKKGLKVGRDVQRFFHQAVKFPPQSERFVELDVSAGPRREHRRRKFPDDMAHSPNGLSGRVGPDWR